MTTKVAKFFEGWKSIITGMGITFRHLPRRAVTIQYPTERPELPELFRGAPQLSGIMGEDPLEFFQAGLSDYNALLYQRLGEGKLPPCVSACPANVDGRGQNALVAEGKYKEAYELVRERNILPSVLGRICHHPCEDACRRTRYDEAISIRPLHRFIAEKVAQSGLARTRRKKPKREKVAVVGGGPAGLAAAFDLAQLEYQVTVFEKSDLAGGMLRLGVPRYRLPRDVLQWDIDRIADLGVEIQGGVEIGPDLTLDDLRKQGYRAIILAVGLQLSRSLPIPGVDLDGVHLALPFLKAANFDQPTGIGKQVVVIGGGNVAIDVARGALRVGAKEVNLACLESRQEMPAFPWEIEEALEEGVKIHPSWGPKAILGKKGKATGLELMRCTSVFDDKGRFSPTFDEEETTVIKGDTVIIAIGQMSDLEFLKESGVEVDERGRLLFDRETMVTSQKDVFACGEVVTGPGSAIGSIASGHEAAISVDRHLRGEDLAEGRTFRPEPELEEYGAVDLADVEKDNLRAEMPMVSPKKRVENFDQVELGLSETQAVAEGCRCLRCESETCVGCGFCSRTCPSYAIHSIEVIKMKGGQRKVDTYELDIDKCVFCGLCAEQCPTGTLTMSCDYELTAYQRKDLVYKKRRMQRKEG